MKKLENMKQMLIITNERLERAKQKPKEAMESSSNKFLNLDFFYQNCGKLCAEFLFIFKTKN